MSGRFADLALAPTFRRIPLPPRQPRVAGGTDRSLATRLRELPSSLAEFQRLAGTGALLRALLRGTAGRVAGVRRFYVLGGPTEAPEGPIPAGVSIRVVDDGEWPALEAIVPTPLRGRFRRARASGRICLAAWRGDRAVGYIWLATAASVGIELYPLTLPGDTVYLHQLFTVPAERGRGIGAALQAAATRYAGAAGFPRGIGVVETGNRSAVQAALRSFAAGLPVSVVGRVTAVHLLTRLYARWDPPEVCAELVERGVSPDRSAA